MSKIHEASHAMNVGNFRKIHEAVQAYADAYQPSDARLNLLNIEALAEKGEGALMGVAMAQGPYLRAISRREIAFADLPHLASRALRVFELSHSDPASIRSLKELLRKLQGRRAVPKKDEPLPEEPVTEAEGQEHKYISVSQLSFTNRIAHFADFIEILRGEKDYQPSEKALNLTGLNEFLKEMRDSDDLVTAAAHKLSDARKKRNEILYTPVDGLVDVAQDVRQYVRAVFGADSAEYTAIKKLEFKKRK